MKIQAKETTCFLGRALELTDGKTVLTVTLDVGPRIIGLKAKDGFNIMYEDVADAVNKDCSSYYGEGACWHIYGGHRLWLSPEDITTYYPDCDPVAEVKLTDDGVVVKPKAWRNVNVQPAMGIKFLPDGRIEITHSMTNLGEERKLCLWALTVMKSGGKMTLPLNTADTGLLPNRNVVMWSYASFKDSRFTIDDDKIVLHSSEKIEPAFKFGVFNRDIAASYEIERDGQKVRFTKCLEGEDGDYPDYACNFESYCTHLIHEIETLSPIKKVPTGGTITHKEVWKIERM